MKKLTVLFISVILAFSAVQVLGQTEEALEGYCEEKETKETPAVHCPETLFTDNDKCLDCHVMAGKKFRLKETAPDAWRVYPNYYMRIRGDRGYYYLTTISDTEVKNFFDYLTLHDIKKATIEIQSPGGSLFDAWRIVGLMREWQADGGTITTKCYGFAASAGFLIMASGTKGHRLVSSHAELMWHELLTFAMFKVATPSSSEEESRVLRHLQDTANIWLSETCTLTKEELDEKIHKREFWIRGTEAKEYGFADGFLHK